MTRIGQTEVAQAPTDAEETHLQLLGRLLTAEEDECRHIAREMHDQCGPDLTALRFQIERLKAEYGQHAGLREHVETLEAIAARLDADIDVLIWALRPAALEGLGLRAALAKYLRNWAPHAGVHAELYVSEAADDRLPAATKSTLYRIAQEALTNVAKHARAQHVEVIVQACGDHITLTVEDDGVGFSRGDTNVTGQGLGLLGMQERVALVAGVIQIESAPGRGTAIHVRVRVPVPGSN